MQVQHLAMVRDIAFTQAQHHDPHCLLQKKLVNICAHAQTIPQSLDMPTPTRHPPNTHTPHTQTHTHRQCHNQALQSKIINTLGHERAPEVDLLDERAAPWLTSVLRKGPRSEGALPQHLSLPHNCPAHSPTAYAWG
mgnify:CR=1 FL=1